MLTHLSTPATVCTTGLFGSLFHKGEQAVEDVKSEGNKAANEAERKANRGANEAERSGKNAASDADRKARELKQEGKRTADEAANRAGDAKEEAKGDTPLLTAFFSYLHFAHLRHDASTQLLIDGLSHL
jgi:hypothetical protein